MNHQTINAIAKKDPTDSSLASNLKAGANTDSGLELAIKAGNSTRH